MYISRSLAKRILKSAGAGRVSDSALTIFQTRMNRVAYDVAEKSVRLAKHAKRRTIGESDIKLAMHN